MALTSCDVTPTSPNARCIYSTQTQENSFSSSQDVLERYWRSVPDLVDISNLSPFNDGMRYLPTCIDVFSKRAWALPIRTMSGTNVTTAFEKILTDARCNMVQSDKGRNF